MADLSPETRAKWEKIAASHPDPAAKARAREVLGTTASKPDTSLADDWLKPVGYGALRGGTLGFSDRLAGLGGWLQDKLQLGVGESAVTGKPLDIHSKDPYEESRADFLADEEESASKNRPANIAGQLLGGVVPTLALAPVGAAAARAAQGAGTAARVGAKLAQPALEGALAGAGNTREDDAGEMVSNAALGAGVAGAIGGTASAVGAGLKKAGGAVRDRLKKNIVNEVAEGANHATTNTKRMHLEGADENIANEIIDGPDADFVRSAYLKNARAGREAIGTVADKVGAENKAAYEAFDKAGRSKIDMEAYQAGLGARQQQLLEAGKDTEAKAVEAFQKEVLALADATGGMDLTQLRGKTTNVQKAAASVLGGLNEHARADVAKTLERVATEAMEDTLTQHAAGNPALEQAAATIRANNKRFNALLSIDSALKPIEQKEASGKGMLVRAAKTLAAPAGLAGVAAMSSGDEDQLSRMGLYAAMGLALVPAARGIQRGITTAGIKLARGEVPAAMQAANKGVRSGGIATAGGLPDFMRITPDGVTPGKARFVDDETENPGQKAARGLPLTDIEEDAEEARRRLSARQRMAGRRR